VGRSVVRVNLESLFELIQRLIVLAFVFVDSRKIRVKGQVEGIWTKCVLVLRNRLV